MQPVVMARADTVLASIEDLLTTSYAVASIPQKEMGGHDTDLVRFVPPHSQQAPTLVTNPLTDVSVMGR